MDREPSYVRAAIVAPANLFWLVSATLSAVLMGDPTPVLVALGMEGMYLGGLSLSPRFRRIVRSRSPARHSEEMAKQNQQLLDELAPSQRDHYLSLYGLREKILVNYRRLPGGGVLVASSEARLDTLLNNFLRLLATLNAYRKHLNAADRSTLEKELESVRKDVDTETNNKLKTVKQNRLDILSKRLQRFVQAEESREIVSHQLASIEDLLQLTHEQSIAIRDPDALTHQLDALSAEVAATDETVRDMERFIAISDELTPPAPAPGMQVRT